MKNIIKKSTILVLTITLLLPFFLVQDVWAEEVNNFTVDIPDKELRIGILKTLGKDISDSSIAITKSDLASLTYLRLPNSNIKES